MSAGAGQGKEREREVSKVVNSKSGEGKTLDRLKFDTPGFAVFNQHVNDAGNRAVALLRHLYDEEGLYPLMKHRHAGTIMAIFDDIPMKPVCHDYALLCFAFVNEEVPGEL